MIFPEWVIDEETARVNRDIERGLMEAKRLVRVNVGTHDSHSADMYVWDDEITEKITPLPEISAKYCPDCLVEWVTRAWISDVHTYCPKCGKEAPK